MNKNDQDQDELNKEMILELFYTTNGNLDEINRAIDEKLKIRGFRKITLFEEFVKNRLAINPRVLKMPQMEISTVESIYLSQYPPLDGLEILDLRKNFIGDEGLEAISRSPLLGRLRELDLRNNGITRLGVKILSESTYELIFLAKAEKNSSASFFATPEIMRDPTCANLPPTWAFAR